MITLNLVPSEDKKEIKMLNIYLSIKNFVYVLLIGTIVLAVALLIAKIILQNNFRKVIDENYLTFNVNKIFSSEVSSFNQELRNTIVIQRDFIPWSEFFMTINNLVTQGVVIQSLEVNEDGLLAMKGFAKTRAALLEFESSLDSSQLFDKVEFPLTTLVNKDDINFEIDLTFDINDFKNGE